MPRFARNLKEFSYNLARIMKLNTQNVFNLFSGWNTIVTRVFLRFYLIEIKHWREKARYVINRFPKKLICSRISGLTLTFPT